LVVGAVVANAAVYDDALGPDALVYLARARQFASFDFLDPATNALLAPGYSLFLALAGVGVGFSPMVIVAAQAALYAGAAELLVGALHAQQLLRSTERTFARGLLLANPNLWFLPGRLGAEFLVAVLIVAITALVLRWRSEARDRLGWTASALAGLLAVTRFEWALLPLAAIPLLGGGRRRASRRLAILLVGPMVVLGANAARNERMFGRLWPFSFSSGLVAYGGNNLNGDGSWHNAATNPLYLPAYARGEYRGIEALASQDVRRHVLEQDRFFRRLAGEAWRARPLDQLATIPLKLGKLWAMPLHFDIYTADGRFRRSLLVGELFDRDRWPWYAPWKHGFYLFGHWAVLAAVVAGLRLCWRRGRQDEAARRFTLYGLALIGGASALYSVPLYGLPRFHGPLLPVLSVFAALALAAAFRSVPSPRA
jgi:hypothetical protein